MAVEQRQDDPSARRHVAESLATLAIGDVVNKAARFAAIVVLTHALPLEQYGLLNLGVALGGIAAVVMRLGLPDIGSRDVALAPGRRDELAARIVTPQATGLIVLTLLACLIVLFVDAHWAPFVLLSGASTLGLAVSGGWLLRGMERMRAAAIASAVGGIAALAGAVVVAATSTSATAGLAALGVGELIGAAWTWRAVRLGRVPRPSLRGLGGLLRESWPLAVAGLVMYAYYANIDTILLTVLRSTEEAGLYSAPYRLFLALNVVGIFAAYALLPLASRAVDADARAGAERLVVSCLAPLAGFGLLCLGMAELLGGRVLGIVFGDPFSAMDTTFILLCTAVPWYAIGYPAGYSAIATGNQRRLLTGAAVAGVLNIGLNAVLIPLMGAEGAAVATTAAMIAASLTWLQAQKLLSRVVPVVATLTIATIAACTAALFEEVRTGVGSATLAAGIAMVLVGGRVGLRRLSNARSRGGGT